MRKEGRRGRKIGEEGRIERTAVTMQQVYLMEDSRCCCCCCCCSSCFCCTTKVHVSV